MSNGERELVRWLQEQSGPPKWPVVLGVGDDMGLVEVGGDQPDSGGAAFVTSDMLLDGVHFETSKHSFEQIGRKAIACSLSDCAAMAVQPIAATVSVAWPASFGMDDLKRLFEGMRGVAGEFDCAIIGGDTTSWSHPLAIDVAMIAGRCPEHQAVRRSGARPGDTLYVTGPLGGSLLGKHLTFTPRVREAHSIAQAMSPYLHAMMDISDGLAIDLHRLCEASGVGAHLIEGLLKRVISGDARRAAEQDGQPALDHALHDGEDFELLLAVAGDAPEPPTLQGVFLLPVGVVAPEGIFIKKGEGDLQPLPAGGYDHLS
jgi:thiamine-monophosphate kinase